MDNIKKINEDKNVLERRTVFKGESRRVAFWEMLADQITDWLFILEFDAARCSEHRSSFSQTVQIC